MNPVVQFHPRASKAFEKAPLQVRVKLGKWARAVEVSGLEAVRLIPGYHDEPLQGHHKGHRSIRLNNQWRAIYEVQTNGQILVTILEVTPHDYRKR